MRAEAADAHQARMLGTAKRAPLLVQERVTYAGERVIELSTSWYRADRYRIHMAITPRGARRTEAVEGPGRRTSWSSPTTHHVRAKVGRRRRLFGRGRSIPGASRSVVLIAIVPLAARTSTSPVAGFVAGLSRCGRGLGGLGGRLRWSAFRHRPARAGQASVPASPSGSPRPECRSPGYGRGLVRGAGLDTVKAGLGRSPPAPADHHRRAARPRSGSTRWSSSGDPRQHRPGLLRRRHGVDLTALDN